MWTSRDDELSLAHLVVQAILVRIRCDTAPNAGIDLVIISVAHDSSIYGDGVL